MSISNQFFSEKLLEGYVKTPLSLKEQAMTRLTIQLSQHSRLKKLIVEDFDKQFECRWRVSEWGRLIGEQYSALCETLPLPCAIKTLLMDRIWLIAIRLFSWNREHRKRFPLTSNAADDILTLTDWTAEGRINEIKVAERLVQDERFPISQRYILACLHFMEQFIRPLWNQIAPEHQSKFLNDQMPPIPMVHSVHSLWTVIPYEEIPDEDPYFISYEPSTHEQSYIVRLWSHRMWKGPDETIIQFDKLFLQHGFEDAVRKGQRTAVVCCWNMLLESTKQEIIVRSALRAFEMYYSSRCEDNSDDHPDDFQNWKLVSHRSTDWYATPKQCSDILYFLVSQMSEEQMVHLFRALLNSPDVNFKGINSPVFDWLLESPYQTYFIPIITKLWSYLDAVCYSHLLCHISDMYINKDDTEEYKDYDYGNLLVELFQKAPDSYYRYVFSTSNRKFGDMVLNILNKIPFQRHNRDIIKYILKYATLEEKRSFIYSRAGEDIVYRLIKDENREKLDLMLSECLPEKEIAEFIKKFLLSCNGRDECIRILISENGEEYVNSLLNWGSFSREEISDFKSQLIWKYLRKNKHIRVPLCGCDPNYLNFWPSILDRVISDLLKSFDTKGVDRVLDLCTASKDARKQYKDDSLEYFKKVDFIRPLRHTLFPKYKLKCLTSKISEFLCWAFPFKEDRKLFKLKLFAEAFPQDVLRQLILHEQWQDIDSFVELFELSAEETKQLKINVMCSIESQYNIFDLLYTSDFEIVSHYLKWGLSDSETLKDFEDKFDNFLCVYKKNWSVPKDWYRLINDRLSDLAIVGHVDLPTKAKFKDEIKPPTSHAKDNS